MKKKSIILTFIILITLLFIRQNREIVDQEEHLTQDVEGKTEVMSYVQQFVPEEKREGSCWTGSNASMSPDAYRCSVGSGLYDPCFETEDGSVVCNVRVDSDEGEFELVLIEELPDLGNAEYSEEYVFYWKLMLEDGSICSLMTGAAPSLPVEDESRGIETFHYYCGDLNKAVTGYDFDKTNPLWITEVIFIEEVDGEDKIVERKEVGVEKVWR